MSFPMTTKAPKGYEAFSTLSPEQQQLFGSMLQNILSQMGPAQGLLGQGQSTISDILGGDTSKFEAPLMRQFQEEIVPQLAERFSGLGAGAQRSSAFQQALGSSGASLAERLGSLRGQLQLGALPFAQSFGQQPFNQAQNLLGVNTQGLMPKETPFWQKLLLGLGGGAAQGLTQFGLGKFL